MFDVMSEMDWIPSKPGNSEGSGGWSSARVGRDCFGEIEGKPTLIEALADDAWEKEDAHETLREHIIRNATTTSNCPPFFLLKLVKYARKIRIICEYIKQNNTNSSLKNEKAASSRQLWEIMRLTWAKDENCVWNHGRKCFERRV
jgi:hypothetical protein